MNRLPRSGFMDLATRRHRRPRERRRPLNLRPLLQALEDRLVLSPITWNTTAAPTGGDWDLPSNWTGGKVPGPSDTAKITGLTSPGTVYLDSGNADSVTSLTTDSSTTLEVITGSLSLGVASSSTFGGTVIVANGASLNVGAGATVQVNSTLMDSGILTFASGDTVGILNAQIAVNGTLNATNDSFSSTNGNYYTAIAVNAGGHLVAGNSTFSLSQLSLDNSSMFNSGDLSGNVFNMPIYVPYNDIQYLGSNATFHDVNINAGTLPSGTLNLNQIGNSNSSLRYVFPGGFTVATGATLSVGTNVSVLIEPTFTVNGTLNFATGDAVSIFNAQLFVNGTLNASNDSFTTNNGNYSTGIQVNSGGHLIASNSTFSLSQLSLDNNSVFNNGDLTGDVFNMSIYVPYNDVQYLASNATFNDININAGTLSHRHVDLNQIGTNTSKLRYVFPNGFTIASGATLSVGTNVSVLIEPTFTVNGTLNFATGDAVSIFNAQIFVNGKLNASSDSFTTNNGNYSTGIQVNSGGHLVASNSTFSLSQLSLDNNSVFNNGDLTGDVFNMSIYVPYNDVQYLASNATFNDININAGTLSTGTLSLSQIGTNISKLRYVFPGGFTVATGATLSVGTNVSVLIEPTFTVNGTLNFAIGDAVSIFNAEILVNGTLNASSDSFTNNNGNYATGIQVNSGGHLIASNSTFSLSQLSLDNNSVFNSGDLTGNVFNMPIYVPYTDVQYLGSNASLHDVGINAGTLASGTLNLNQIGTNTSSLRYVFPNGFTIASGATLSVGTNVSVLIEPTFSVNGTLNFAIGDAVSIFNAQILVNGTLNASSDSFTTNNGNYSTGIQVNSGGHLTISSSAYGLSSLTLSSGSTDTLKVVVFSGQLNINSGANVGTLANPSITGDDFSNVGAKGIVATGDPNASIPFAGNYWGTTVLAQIAAKILDHNADATRPTVAYQPFVSGASGTVASPQTTTFSPTAQTVNLSATVSTSPAGVAINEGTEIFTILNGTQVIGQTTAPANVSNGAVTAVYTLPANTPAGQYIIEASYSGTGNYLPSTDILHFLTVSPAPTTTTTVNRSATFSGVSDQSVALSAQVSSSAGAINEGIVTFTIKNGGTPVGASVSGNVVGNAANATYTLLKLTPGGVYTIQAVYTDPDDFTTSTGIGQLTVSAATTTVTPAAAATEFSASSGEGFSLSANVSSPAGTINEGAVTFTILDGSGKQVGSPIILSVLAGVASGNSSLPAKTPVGSYTIQAVYDGTASFATSLVSNSNLTVSAATTATAAANVQIPFNSAAQAVSLTANVTSPSGTVNEGTVTFTILSGATPIGSAVSGNVASGVATASYTLPGGTAIGTYTIKAVYTDPANFLGSTDTNHSLGVTGPPGTQWKIHTQPSSTATAGQAFATQPVIYEEDQFGNLETGDNSTVVTASLASGNGPLKGTLTATVVAGVATFTNLSDNTAETITLNFAGNNLTPDVSTSILVSAATASQLVVTQQPSATATAGQAFATQPVVKEEDQYGNVITTDSTHTVTAARGSVGTSNLQGSNLTVTLTNGVATFGGLSYIKAETMDIGFSTNAGGVSSATSSTITVGPAAAFRLMIHTQPSSTATAGQAFATQPVVYELDQYGNLETTDSSTVIAAAVTFGNGPLLGTTTAQVSGGVATFTNLADSSVGTISLGFSGGGLNVGPSNNVAIGPGAATHLVIQTPPFPLVTAGNPLTDPIVLYEEDQYNNIVTTDNSTVVTASLATGAGTLNGTKTATVQGGVASFDNLEDDTAGMLSLQFTGGGLPAVTSNPSTVVPAAAALLKIVVRPPGVVVAGQAFTVGVNAYDNYGNVATSFSGPVTVGLASGAGTLSGNTMNAANGVATFNNVIATMSGPITLSASTSSSNIQSSPATPPVVVNPSTPSSLVIHTQPSPTAIAGQAFAIQPVIWETDQFGNLVASDNSTVVTAILGSGTGPLAGTTTATVNGGVATFTNLADTIAGPITLQFTGGGLNSTPSSSIVISPTAPSKLVIQTQPSSSATAGQPFPTQPVVWEEDQYSNLETGDNATVVTATLNSGTGPLQGTAAVTVKAGVATFTNLADDTAETITLNFSGHGFTAGPSTSIAVSPASLGKLVIKTQSSPTATAGQPLATQPVIWEEDQYHNVLTNDNSTVLTAFLGSGAGPLQGTTTATVSGGVATFTNLADNTAETITLAFTGGGLTSAPSIPIVINPATASKLVIHTPPSATAVAGQVFASQPVIYETDQYGNLVTTDNTTQVTAALNSGTGPLHGTAITTVTGGVATFTNLSDNTAETITLKFSGGGLSSAPGNAIVVSPATASKLVIHTQPSPTAIAGKAFATQPVLYEADQYDNLETGDNTTVITATLNSGSGPLQGTAAVTVKGGVATFTNLADNTAETITLKFSGGGLTAGPSTNVLVSAAATKLVIHIQPSATATAGQPFPTQPVIYEEDQFGNLETSDNSTVVTVTLNSGAGPLQGTTSVTVSGGVATFTNLADDLVETITLKFTSGSLTPAISNPIVITPGAATQLVVVTPPPGSVAAGDVFGLVVHAEDRYNNVDSSFDGSVTVGLASSGSGGTLGGTLTVTASSGVATFSNLTLDQPTSFTLAVSSQGLTSATTPPANVTPGNNAVPLVTMTHVQLVTNKKHQVTQIQVVFSGGVNAAQAQSTAEYRLVTAGKKGSFTAKSAKPISLRSASYTAASDTVTLTLTKPVKLTKPVQFQVNGLAPSGLTDSAGRLIDGDHNGTPGGNAVAILRGGGATIAAVTASSGGSSPLGAIVDILVEHGGLLDTLRQDAHSRKAAPRA